MALSTMRMSLRPCLLGSRIIFTKQAALSANKALVQRCAPMASSAKDQMQEFWDKNHRLGRPVAPWIVYKWEFPMFTSLSHRTTGIMMGVALYGLSIGLLASPYDVTQLVNIAKGWELPMWFWFPFKSAAAFPLCYHYLNGIRHLSWDYYGGYEVKQQYYSGGIVYTSAIALSILLGSLSYWAW